MKLVYEDVKKQKLSSIHSLTQGEVAIIRPDDRFKIEVMFDYYTNFHNGDCEDTISFSFQQNRDVSAVAISQPLSKHEDKTIEDFTIWASEQLHDRVWDDIGQEDERHKVETKRLRDQHYAVNHFRGRLLAEQKAGL